MCAIIFICILLSPFIYTYWVEYSYEYDWYNALDNHWELINDFDSGLFKCLKKDIPSEVEKAVKNKLEG